MQSTVTTLPGLAAHQGAHLLSGRAWLARVATTAVEEKLRSDSRVTLSLIAEALVVSAEGGATAAPTWKKLAKEVSRTWRTVARRLRWLRGHRLLVLIEHAAIEGDHRLDPALEGSWPAVYLLTAPLADPQPSTTAR